MIKLQPNPILEFNPNQLEQVRKLFNYEDINRLHQDLKILEDWIKMQHHFLVKEYDKEYLERYLIHSKGSIERAKKLFDKMCTFRRLMPAYLQNFDIENEFKNHFKIFNPCLLPKPTPENHRILLYSTQNPDDSIFKLIDVSRYIILCSHYLNSHDYNAGIELIADTRKFSFGMITKLSTIEVANTLTIITDAIGLRMRGIHLLSQSIFIEFLYGIVKPALSKKLASRLHVHDNMESLYKFIPKDYLPSDLGGDLDTSDVLAGWYIYEFNTANLNTQIWTRMVIHPGVIAKTFAELSSPAFVQKMKYLESAATDESKRLCSKFNEEYSGMPGSFKVLTVD